MKEEVSKVKRMATTIPIDVETNSQKMRTFEQKYYFCTLKKMM